MVAATRRGGGRRQRRAGPPRAGPAAALRLLAVGAAVEASQADLPVSQAPVRAAEAESTRLYGNINKYAYYFADLLVGTPNAQKVSVIVDTGSALCGFPCAACGHCGSHLDPLFDITKSKSAEVVPCSNLCDHGCNSEQHCAYEQSYAEGSSVTGYWFKDTVELVDRVTVDNAPVNATLGCHDDERKLFYTQRVNGIMGLAPRKTKDGRPTILRELFSDKAHISTELFSLCLGEWGGLLTVGSDNEAYHTYRVGGSGGIQWIPMTLPGYYAVAPQKLSMHGVVLVEDPGAFGMQTIVDSGTTFTYFPSEVYNVIDKAFEAFCTAPPGCSAKRDVTETGCWMLDDPKIGLSDLPTLSMSFGMGVDVAWPPEAYMYARNVPGLWCRAFADNGLQQNTVLGLSWMLHKDLILDVANVRLGIAEAACPEYRLAPEERPTNEVFDVRGTSITVYGNRWTSPQSWESYALGGAGLLLLVTSIALFAYAHVGETEEQDDSSIPESSRTSTSARSKVPVVTPTGTQRYSAVGAP